MIAVDFDYFAISQTNDSSPEILIRLLVDYLRHVRKRIITVGEIICFCRVADQRQDQNEEGQ